MSKRKKSCKNCKKNPLGTSTTKRAVNQNKSSVWETLSKNVNKGLLCYSVVITIVLLVVFFGKDITVPIIDASIIDTVRKIVKYYRTKIGDIADLSVKAVLPDGLQKAILPIAIALFTAFAIALSACGATVGELIVIAIQVGIFIINGLDLF